MRNYLLLLVALLVACGTDATPAEPKPEPAVLVEVKPEPELVPLSLFQVPMPDPIPVVDPYAGAEDWCHEVDDLRPCARPGDTDAHPDLPRSCEPDPHTGRRRQCIDPWWVAGHERLCVPVGFFGRERARAVAELEAFVYRRVGGQHRGVCRPQHWWRDGQGHNVWDGYCNPDPLRKLLRVVSWREVRHDPRWTHLGKSDVQGASNSWAQKRELYADVNPHYWQSYRWRSRGYGQMPAYHLWRFDKRAPPEILCNRVIANEVYLETLRACHRKLVDLRAELPDWWDLHHCASGGGFDRPEEISPHRFVRRAKAVDLDPFQKVPAAWLGEAIDHEMSEVRRIEGEIASYVEGEISE